MIATALFFLILYVLVLLQTSFLVHFFPQGMVPNLVVIAVVLISILERSRSYTGITSAIFGGLLLDVFSGRPFGFWVFILVAISLAIKLVLERYVRVPIPKKI